MTEDRRKTETQDTRRQIPGMPKMIAINEEPYYANCTLLESTPFDISLLFGKIRPHTDDKGQRSLIERYDRQILVPHSG